MFRPDQTPSQNRETRAAEVCSWPHQDLIRLSRHRKPEPRAAMERPPAWVLTKMPHNKATLEQKDLSTLRRVLESSEGWHNNWHDALEGRAAWIVSFGFLADHACLLRLHKVCRQEHLTRNFPHALCTYDCVHAHCLAQDEPRLKSVSVRVSFHLHAIHDVMCLSVRWSFLVSHSLLLLFLFHLFSFTVYLFSVQHFIFNVVTAEG